MHPFRQEKSFDTSGFYTFPLVFGSQREQQLFLDATKSCGSVPSQLSNISWIFFPINGVGHRLYDQDQMFCFRERQGTVIS